MEAAHNRTDMASWEPLHMKTEIDEGEGHQTKGQALTGLVAEPSLLHEQFHDSAEHLAEVQMNHQQVLAAAGMLPETHIAEVEPERRLAWMVDQLHGTLNPDGFTIPLHGADVNDIQLFTLHEQSQRQVKISIRELGHTDFERVLPLPSDAEEVQAHFINGRLHLRW